MTQVDPPRILQVINTLSVRDGGPALAAAELHFHLNLNHIAQSRLVNLQDQDVPQVTDMVKGYPRNDDHSTVIPVDVKLRNARAFQVRMNSEVSQVDAVVIHGYYLWWVPILARLCRRSGKPFIVIPHGCLTERQQQFSRRRKLIFDATVGHLVRDSVATFVTATPSEQADLTAAFPATPVTTARLGVTSPGGKFGSTGGLHIPVRLLSVSRIAPKKRIDLMLRCVSELARRGIDSRVTIAGEGDAALMRRLVALTQELSIDRLVKFVGQVVGDDKDELYRSSDILLLPSEDENFGLAPIEALMRGCPVIVSSKVSSTLILEGEACAVIANPTGPSMADKVADWLGTAGPTFEERRATGIAISMEAYSWESVMEDWIRVFASLS